MSIHEVEPVQTQPTQSIKGNIGGEGGGGGGYIGVPKKTQQATWRAKPEVEQRRIQEIKNRYEELHEPSGRGPKGRLERYP